MGCNDNMAGYSHALSIVVQPRHLLLVQSFISHYSLATWMKKISRSNESGLAGHLTFDELLAKLDKIDRLMRIDDWTVQANQDYLDLFNVDKTLEMVDRTNGKLTIASIISAGTRPVNTLYPWV